MCLTAGKQAPLSVNRYSLKPDRLRPQFPAQGTGRFAEFNRHRKAGFAEHNDHHLDHFLRIADLSSTPSIC